MYMHYNHCHRATDHLQLNTLLLFIYETKYLSRKPVLFTGRSATNKIPCHEGSDPKLWYILGNQKQDLINPYPANAENRASS
jgi:hypothetical protein